MLFDPLTQARPLAWGFAGLAAASFALIVLGALVRAHGAGLSCPDWPLCFGEWIPVFDLRVAFEWSHRVLAGSVTLGLAGLTLGIGRKPGWLRALRRPLVVAWALLAVQIALGALTVLLRLVPWSVTAHLLVGTSFCGVLAWTSRDLLELGRDRAPVREQVSSSALVVLALTVLLLFVQITLGGMVSSHAAGLACTSFPTCDGAAIVPTLDGLVGLHVLHRLCAYALFPSYLLLAWLTLRSGRTGPLARWGMRLMLLQIGLGAANVLLMLPVEVTALHSALALAIVLVTGLIVREVVYARAELPSRTPVGGEALEAK